MIMDPRLLSHTGLYDVAGIIHQALPPHAVG
jgi:hypothetical protein